MKRCKTIKFYFPGREIYKLKETGLKKELSTVVFLNSILNFFKRRSKK